MQSGSNDLAGNGPEALNYLHVRHRINCLIDRYLAIETLSDRLSDLPNQFTHPRPRPWEPINWKDVHASQIIGIDPAIFLQVLTGAAEIETPIRDYSIESWNYLRQFHPQMALFMGGEYDEQGNLRAIGTWEKEERQHAPVFSKLYQQLTGEKLQPRANTVSGYQSSGDSWEDMHRHVKMRISSEWGALSSYLWLMAHSTGELQNVIAQPLQDEVNHLAKFWGFSRWLFADSYLHQLSFSTKAVVDLLRHHKQERTHGKDVLGHSIDPETIRLGIEIAFTMTRIMTRMRRWNRELSYSYLKHLLGESPVISSKQAA